MENITILEKSYIVHKHSSAKSLKYILDKEFQDLDVEITDISFSKKRHAEITLEGDDKVIAKNFLIANFGTIRSIADIEIGDTIYGLDPVMSADVVKIYAVSFIPLNPSSKQPEPRVHVLLEDMYLIESEELDHWLANKSQTEYEAEQGTIY